MTIILLTAAWVVVCGGLDLAQRKVSNWLIALGWMGAVLLRANSILSGKGNVAIGIVITLSIWALAITYWILGWWGAADAKFLMALSLAFPDLWMLLAMITANLAISHFMQARFRRQSGSLPKAIPAVTCLGAGWLVWAALALVYRIA